MNTETTPQLYLCVDCGGTKSSAVICNSAGEIVGRGLGGQSNFSYLGLQPFVDVLKATVEQALSQAMSSGPIDLLTAPKFASVWIAVAGVDSPSDVRALTASLSELFSIPPGDKLIITNDAHLLTSPLNVHPELKSAVAVIAGTGSVVITFARDDSSGGSRMKPSKVMARAGGWGWILGDAGSGVDVGREAVREILALADRSSVDGLGQDKGESSSTNSQQKTLRSRIFSHFGVTEAADIFTFVYATDPRPEATPSGTTAIGKKEGETAQIPQGILQVPREHRLSQLAPLVFQSAFEDQDEVALAVLKRCAGSLAHQIAMLLTPPSNPAAAKPNAVEASSSIICFGGSLVGVPEYRALILDELRDLGHVFPAMEFVGNGDVAAAAAKGLAMTASV